MPRTWTIGARPECDLVVDLPHVSGRHCLLTLDDERLFLKDLGSTNGTYVNGIRVEGAVRVTRADVVTLGTVTPMPWPQISNEIAAVAVSIGRESDNDFVVPLASVSGRHARLIWEGTPGEAIIEDLGSANGTAVGAPDRKVARAVVMASDIVYFGVNPVYASHILAMVDPSIAVPLTFAGAALVIGRDRSCDAAFDLATLAARHARLARSTEGIRLEDLGSASGTFVNGRRITATTPVKSGDLIGLGSHAFRLIVPSADRAPAKAASPPRSEASFPLAPANGAKPQPMRSGESDPVAGSPVSRRLAVLLVASLAWGAALIVSSKILNAALPTCLSFLGIGAVALGAADGLFGPVLDCRRRGLSSRIGLLCAVAAAQSLVVWGALATLGGASAAGLAVLMLATAAGAAFGVFVRAATPDRSPVWPAFSVFLFALMLLGGEIWRLPNMPGAVKGVAGFVPSRWAFEGLLLLSSPDVEAAEGYFPAATDRMGPAAAMLALGLTFVGFSAATAIMVWPGRPPVPTPSGPSTVA